MRTITPRDENGNARPQNLTHPQQQQKTPYTEAANLRDVGREASGVLGVQDDSLIHEFPLVVVLRTGRRPAVEDVTLGPREIKTIVKRSGGRHQLSVHVSFKTVHDRRAVCSWIYRGQRMPHTRVV